MTQKQVIAAYKALNKLSTQPMPIKTAYALHKLRRTLKPAWEFQCEQENILLDKLKPELLSDGQVRFNSPEDLQEWNETMSQVSKIESDIEILPVTVVMDESMRITLDDMDVLEGIVIFEEG